MAEYPPASRDDIIPDQNDDDDDDEQHDQFSPSSSRLPPLPDRSRDMKRFRRSSVPTLRRTFSRDLVVNAEDREPLITTRHYSTTSPDEVVVTADSLGLKPYKRRFYVLFLFSLMCFMNGAVWGTWGPIAHSTEDVFNMTDGEIALLSNWGPIGFLLTVIPFSWASDYLGLRISMVVSSGLIFLSAGIRLFVGINPDFYKWALNIGQLLNGLTLSFGQIAPALVSSVWFPVNQRTTATAISSMCNPLGAALQSILGPYIVSEFNLTHPAHWSKHSNRTDAEIKKQFDEIMIVLYIHMAAGTALFLASLIYFPNKPPMPPSLSASMDSIPFKEAIKSLIRHRQYWLFVVASQVPMGVYIGWYAMLEVNLKTLGIKQTEVGMMMFLNVIFGNILGVGVGAIADTYFKGHFKSIMVVGNSFGAVMVVWFTLQCAGYIPVYYTTVYISVIMLGVFLMSTMPLIYEVTCELSHPVNEGVSMIIPIVGLNVIALLFLLIPAIPGLNLGTMWMNWLFMASTVLSPVMLLLCKVDYKRLRIDSIAHKKDVNVSENDSENDQSDDQKIGNHSVA
ncbi:solute carrier family 49 member 4 homolog isoform X1 [Tubulanus polymorphus]|uniref:solute carrier family 49 member 4 homolog isoform X1 n=1 Tax=Tubulanus polymorphus TaxID=672921 RepID=UPI003DA1EA85